MTYHITLTDPMNGTRDREPITFTLPEKLQEPLWWAITSEDQRILCQRLTHESTQNSTAFIATVSFSGTLRMRLDRPLTAAEVGEVAGIHRLPGREKDCFVRLNTGCFDLEMCRGTAQGVGSSKWGLRHFRCLQDNVELLPSGNNAIGGFYGPFFTPENGLINPPEHTLVDIEILEEGPVYHHYRMHGTIPDGLLAELRGKHFTIDWKFSWNTPWFQRRYWVDDFSTVINGRSVTNKITVGDEFESGPGKLLFDRFAAYGGTRYRAGDPYAEELVAMVVHTVTTSENQSPKFAEFREQLADMASAHWDLYWRMFCRWENVLDEAEIRERLGVVRARAHVRADLNEREWRLTDSPVNVSAVPDETVFPGPASKTVEYDSASGRAMIWWTSRPSGAFQIVQRRQSGWVNWGSNGENECPELPVGVDIKTACGIFADNWMQIADGLETPPQVAVSQEEKS
ncbi:hypothetical protein [Escherichia coli]|uniref:Uncharacterized protein n=1 Tax=Escherichia coli TaxID=562 RepID=A0A3P5DKJ4_ECOLX|nr:hypothetical protein [Escherichia coli]MCW4338399.1 hypothetical protein [Klebsiella pneumoniae]EEY5833794.1 hypothetical protein [Escherichia coli]EFM3381575.1 hypothetical protein [Escherichia coli]EFN3956567.1 hypothetical protein [Escherichia coli]EFN7045379.1 hypothetical protein [Escherichia coli]